MANPVTQKNVREMVGKQVAASLAMPEDLRNPKNNPLNRVNSIMEDKFAAAFYAPDKRLSD